MGAMKVTDQNFESEVLQAGSPVLVDFWAEWCGPCKQIGPVLDEIASELNGRIKVVKVNIDENPNTPTTYAVRSIPTLVLFKDGKVIGQHVGAAAKSKILQFIGTTANAA